MSRAASGQLTTPSRNIFVTQVRQADGTLRPVISSQALSDQSVRVNHTWQGEIWLGNEEYTSGKYRKKYVPAKCTNNGALFLLMLLQSRGNIYQRGGSLFLNYDILEDVASWIFGVNQQAHLRLINNYAIATTSHPLAHHQQLGIFSRAEMDPAIVVDAAMRGQEDIVLNILRADPSYLLKPAEVENSVGVKSIGTPLQAAIMANDVQLIERMKEHFERIPNGLTIMYGQMLQIYRESLRAYYDKQQALVDQLTVLQTNGTATPDDLAALALAEARANHYLRALQNNGNPNYDDSNYLNVIIAAHDQAQIDNTFDFKPYVEAICRMDPNDPQLQDVMALINARTPDETAAVIARTGVSPTQTDAARAKPFDQLTLVEKLNRFREELVKHMKQEMIFNPHHILEGLRQNDRIWDGVAANRVADPNNYAKRSVIFSQLVGWAQRNAAEPVKQDIRQGTYYLTEQNEARTRQSRFNDLDARYNVVRNSRVDVSMMSPALVSDSGRHVSGRVLVVRAAYYAARQPFLFQNLCRAKTASFQNLLHRWNEHAPASPSVGV